MKNNFILRTLTGILFVLILVGGIIGGSVPFGILFLIITLLSVREFCTLVNQYEQGIHLNTYLCTIAGGLLFLTFYHYQHISSWVILPLYLCFLIAILVVQLYAKKSNPAGNWAFSFMSQVYVALPFALLPLLSINTDEQAGRMAYTWIYPMALFVFLWVNDTFAYLSGLTLHNIFPWKHFPSVSPKKTWVGSTGGCVFTLLAAVGIWYVQPGTLSLLQWLGFAAIVVVSGTYGDLVESHLKRQLGIKDSSHILPGHGGLLDRFDSALLAIPAVTVYFLML